MQHVFIVGSKGIPGNYGGYETFVDKLTEYHQNELDIRYHVACAVDRAEDVKNFKYHNAHCFSILRKPIGSAQAIFYDTDALQYCIDYIKAKKINHPIVYVLACRIGPFFKRYVKQIHTLGGVVYVNPDGHEWMRAKWCAPVRKYWKISEQLMVKYADLLICDSKNIEKYIQNTYAKYKPKTTFIAYGAETRKSTLADDDEKLLSWYQEKGLKAKEYYLVVGRFVPENNYEIMIREFMRSKTTKYFVLITNVSDKFLEELKKKTGFHRDPRIKFVGTVYDKELLMKIRENAYGYFHGHEVGGTNPSLLEALGSTDLNLLLDVGFNREVAEDSALYWSKTPGNLAALIEKADMLFEEEIRKYGELSTKRIQEAYSWEYICGRYRSVFLKGMRDRMKILAIHNFHRKGSASGDDQVFKSETTLLEAHGHQVVRYSVSNDEFDQSNVFGKIVKTFGMTWSFKNYRKVMNLVKAEKSDIVHVHTFFPLLSPSILYAAKRSGAKVVATLHDTRFVCPCATSLRGTQLCNLCGDGHYLRMCKYGCFKGSRVQSLLVAMNFKYHRIRKTFYKQIDKYICLNENQMKLLREIGFDPKKLVKKYNFVPDAEANLKPQKISGIPERYAVFYGRIGEEKGIRVLMKVWEHLPDVPLVVMGGGPLEDEFREWAEKHDNIYFLGYTQHDKCLTIVKGGEFVVFPSIWYEGCSMVEIESESFGNALVATDLGFSEEAIKNGYNGYKVKLGDYDGFVTQIRHLWQNPDECRRMGQNARADYEEKYMPEDNYMQLISIYESLR